MTSKDKSKKYAVDWKPDNDRQEEVLSRSEFENACGGMRGGGKSAIGRVWLFDKRYINNPRYRTLTLRRNAADLDDWCFKFRQLTNHQIPITGKPATIHYPGGGLGTLGHLADKNAIDHYVGQEYHRILFEELNLVPTEDEYLKVLASCRSDAPEIAPQVMSNFNPGNVGSGWIKKRFIDKSYEKPYQDTITGLWRIFIPLYLQENKHLPAGYEATLRLLPKRIQAAWLDGNWDAALGQYFRRFPAMEQPFEIPDDEINFYGSFDFGNSETGHSSFGGWHIDKNNIAHRMFTWYHKLGHAAPDQARELRDYVKSFPFTKGRMPKLVFADPAIFNKRNDAGLGVLTKTVASYFVDEGFNFTPANNQRVNGWRTMDAMFSPDAITGDFKMFFWDGYNQTLIDDLEIQVPADNNPDDIEPNDHDHTVDECRYGCVAIFSITHEAARKQKLDEQRQERRIEEKAWAYRGPRGTSDNDSWMSR